jgi:hypothetical protein
MGGRDDPQTALQQKAGERFITQFGAANSHVYKHYGGHWQVQLERAKPSKRFFEAPVPN